MTELDEAAELVSFFGCNLKKVNFFSVRIAVGLKYRPDWLRAAAKLTGFPRFTQQTKDFTFIDVRKHKPLELCERLIWVVEDLKKEWTLNSEGFGFEDPHEALLFKLRWS